MSVTDNVQEKLETRINKLEDVIANQGVGSKQLRKAKHIQRNVNLAIFIGGIAAIGSLIWAVNRAGD